MSPMSTELSPDTSSLARYQNGLLLSESVSSLALAGSRHQLPETLEEGVCSKRPRFSKEEPPDNTENETRKLTSSALAERETSCTLTSSGTLMTRGTGDSLLEHPVFGTSSSQANVLSQQVLTAFDGIFADRLIVTSGAVRATTDASASSSCTDHARIPIKIGAGDTMSVPPIQHTHDYTRLPTTGKFVTATATSCGLRFYFPTRSGWKTKVSDIIKKSKKGSSLLTRSIYRILDEIDAERIAKRQDYLESELNEVVLVNSGLSSGNLWVDKYAPRRFTDLISDERVNREALRWVKQWDQCVFGEESAKAKEARKVRQIREELLPDKNKPRQQDRYGRPERKILLLAGPPGLGKTTLAHIIAETAGYNIVEINASDERTGPIVRNKIADATQMRSVMGDRRPNLVIIDEIDGAASGGEANLIKLLVDMALAEPESVRTKHSVSKKSRQIKPLLRPIICICNDQYATALKPLRRIAQIYVVSTSMPSALAKRLMSICEAESFTADIRHLRTLCARTSCDIRSCLNILQFVNAKFVHGGNKFTLDPDTIAAAAADMSKDAKESFRTLWGIIFEIWGSKKRGNIVWESSPDERRKYLSILVPTVQNSDDVDKVMKGCFENYTRVKYHDDLFCSKMDAIGDWVFLYDTLSRRIQSNFTFELSPYLPYSIAVFHEYFAGSANQVIEYPNADYETYILTRRNENIFTSLLSALPPTLKRSYPNVSTAAVELISPLLRILNPNLKKVNVQLIKPVERQVLARVVNLLILFNVTFVQEKNEEGAFIYRVEPPIDELVRFSTVQPVEPFCGQYALRQLFAQEMEREVIRQAEEAKDRRVGKPYRLVAEGKAADETKENRKGVPIKEKCATDFFGRPILPGKDAEGSSNGGKQTARRVLFRFNEGCTNAVRKNLRVYDLLPGAI